MKIHKMIFCIVAFFYSSILYSDQKLKFSWENSTAEVIQTHYKNNKSVKVKYSIKITPVVDGYTVNQSEVEILSFNQQTNISPKLEKTLKAVVLLPLIKIDHLGNPIEVIDEEKYFENLAITVNDPKYTELLKTSEMREILITKAIEDWCHWVCLWVGDRIFESKPLVEKEKIEFAGILLPNTSITTHHGLVGNNGNVKLTYESTMGGDELVSGLKDMASQLSKTKVDKKELASQKVDVEKKIFVEALIDPGTLKPSKVVSESKTYGSSIKGNYYVYESKEYVFKWQLGN